VGQGLFPATLLDQLVDMPLPKAILYLTIIGNLGLRKYLAIWLINEGSCILSGISLERNEGVTGKATDLSQINWGRVANVLPWTFESATNVNQKIASFNINTNDWCKRYIFKRLMWVGNKDVSMVAALLFLSLWHGFKPGYLFTFSAEFVVLLLQQRLIARHIRLGLDKSNVYAVLVCWPVVLNLAAYAYAPFETLTWARTVNMFSGVSWYMHIAVFDGPRRRDGVGGSEPKPKAKKDGDKTGKTVETQPNNKTKKVE
jgi:lysophospholipid acyltransferase 5